MSKRVGPAIGLALLLSVSIASASGFILTFHHFGVPSDLTLSLTAEDLDAQIEQLLSEGYRFRTLDSATQPSDKIAYITFDDGYADVFANAFSLLRARKIPATLFVATERIGTPGFLSWDELRVMQDEGWLIASHTLQHASLVDLTPASIRRELADSRAAIVEQLGAAGDCLAYPFGRHDERVRRAAAATYRCGFTTGFGDFSDPLAVGRPLSTPFDNADLRFRLETGTDFRTPLVLAQLGYWLWPGEANRAYPTALYNPARFAFMGSGRVALDWQGNVLYQEVFLREGRLALSGMSARVGGSYSEATLVWSVPPFSLGAGVSSDGPRLAVAWNILDYAEAWGAIDGAGRVSSGVEIVPLDYLRVQAGYHPLSGPAAEFAYALPLFAAEGRPLRVFAGYAAEGYAGVDVRVGSLSFRAAASTGGAVRAGFRIGW